MGTAIGDALGRPVEGMDRSTIADRYGRIEGYIDDGDLQAGRWTDDTQFTFVLIDALSTGLDVELPKRTAARYRNLEPRRWGPSTSRAVDKLAHGVSWLDSGADSGPTNGAAMRAAPFGVVWALRELSKEDAFDYLRPVMEITHGHPASVVAAFGQAFAVRRLLLIDRADLHLGTFWISLQEMVDWAERMYDNADRSVSERLRILGPDAGMDIDSLLHKSDGAGTAADSAWPFSLAVFCANSSDATTPLLEAVNAGGDADTTAAMVGALAGALHGWNAFPRSLRENLEDADALLEKVDILYRHLS